MMVTCTRFFAVGIWAFDPSIDSNRAIMRASEQGRITIVKRLLEDPRVDPSANDNFAVRMAAERGKDH